VGWDRGRSLRWGEVGWAGLGWAGLGFSNVIQCKLSISVLCSTIPGFNSPIKGQGNLVMRVLRK